MPRMAGNAAARRGRRTTGYGLVALLAGALLPTPASADTMGGAYAGPVPRVTSLQCRTDCVAVRSARPGSLVLLRGTDLDGIETVTFLGAAKASGDEVNAQPERVSARQLTVRVPRGAVGGRVLVTSEDGVPSKPSRTRLIVDTSARPVPAGAGLEVAVQGTKVFFDAERRATVSYMLKTGSAANVIVEVVRSADGVAIARFDQGLVQVGEPRTLTWDGTVGGKAAAEGRYEFRVIAQNADGVRASQAPAGDPAAQHPNSFLLLGHKFPVRGAHTYGDGFGAGRGHEGVDLMSDCGTPVVAARGGTVKIKQFHSAAGNYVVIDGEQVGEDYVYMHLREAALVDKGDRVRTGQRIGFVGQTGRASACHLHFELWSAPGWYTGGNAIDAMPSLKAWDQFS